MCGGGYRNTVSSRPSSSTLPERNTYANDRRTTAEASSPYGRSAISEANFSRFEIIDYAKLKIGAVIGSGATGDVYRAEYDSAEVAVKLLRKRNISDLELDRLVRESQLMLKLRHPNVLLTLGITSDRMMNHGIITELMDYSLDKLIAAEEIRTSSSPWVQPFPSIVLDVARGMTYLHEHDVIHRDLKPANVLIDLAKMKAKVGDFGDSRDTIANGGAGGSMTMTQAGTPLFMAPEVLREERCGYESDVWSFGGMLVQMATRMPPYAALVGKYTPHVIMGFIADGDVNPLTGVHESDPDWPAEIAELAARCCLDQRADRPTFAEILDALKRQTESMRASIVSSGGRTRLPDLLKRGSSGGNRYSSQSPVRLSAPDWAEHERKSFSQLPTIFSPRDDEAEAEGFSATPRDGEAKAEGFSVSGLLPDILRAFTGRHSSRTNRDGSRRESRRRDSSRRNSSRRDSSTRGVSHGDAGSLDGSAISVTIVQQSDSSATKASHRGSIGP